jgi:flagellar hook-associated protein 1 FlgK
MTFGFGIGAGLRALTAARIGMQTAGNNVANANTPGYSRQRVELVSSLPFAVGRGLQIGSGVDVAAITRLFDDGIERRLRIQSGVVAEAQVDLSRLDELESLLAEPDSGLSSTLSAFFGAVSRLQTDPADRALRSGVVQSGSDLAQGFQLLSRRMGDLGTNTFTEVRGLVRLGNDLASSIAELNGQIAALEAHGSPANDLRDTRAQQVKKLAELVDVNAIERSSGAVDVLVGGQLLVAGSRAAALTVDKTGSSTTLLRVTGGSPIQPREGRIAALLRHEQQELPRYGERVDRLARNLILEVNRLHTTGMPRSGPFSALLSHYGAADGDGDGVRGDELLSQGGLPFQVERGELWIAVTDLATGAMQRTRIAVDPSAMSLRDVANALSQVEHVSATIDPSGRLRVAADAGFGFDFSTRLDPRPDALGTFGGGNAAIGSSAAGPFDLSGQTFPVSFTVTTGTPAAPLVSTVTLDATDFVNPGAATAEELAAAINADAGAAVTAAAVGGRLVVRSDASGAGTQLALANVGAGTALAAIGLSTAPARGQDHGVEVAVEGAFTGSGNGRFTFAAEGDGQIGVTQGLRVRVLDEHGQLVTTLDVGAGYEPGEPLDLGNGVKVSFGAGEIAGSSGHAFALDLLADSDSSDILVALGMNSFFHGTGAADIEVNAGMAANIDLFAAGLGTADGDAGNLDRMIALRGSDVADLGDHTLENFWADVVGEVGFATAGAEQTLASQGQLLQHLEAERESISGVNIDEEMMDMVRYQQSFEAAARFLSTVQELTQTLINIGR